MKDPNFLSRKKSLLVSLIVCAAFPGIFASPAWADTDYHCLNLCVAAGQTGNACLKQCTYGEAPHSKNNFLPDHRIFSTMRPDDNPDAPLKEKQAVSHPASKDYKCIAQCLRANMQYDLCEQSCAREETKKGSAVTSDIGQKILSGSFDPQQDSKTPNQNNR